MHCFKVVNWGNIATRRVSNTYAKDFSGWLLLIRNRINAQMFS